MTDENEDTEQETTETEAPKETPKPSGTGQQEAGTGQQEAPKEEGEQQAESPEEAKKKRKELIEKGRAEKKRVAEEKARAAERDELNKLRLENQRLQNDLLKKKEDGPVDVIELFKSGKATAKDYDRLTDFIIKSGTPEEQVAVLNDEIKNLKKAREEELTKAQQAQIETAIREATAATVTLVNGDDERWPWAGCYTDERLGAMLQAETRLAIKAGEDLTDEEIADRLEEKLNSFHEEFEKRKADRALKKSQKKPANATKKQASQVADTDAEESDSVTLTNKQGSRNETGSSKELTPEERMELVTNSLKQAAKARKKS